MILLLLEANIDPDKTSRSLIISVLMRSRQYTAAAAIKEDEYSLGEYADMEEEVGGPFEDVLVTSHSSNGNMKHHNYTLDGMQHQYTSTVFVYMYIYIYIYIYI